MSSTNEEECTPLPKRYKEESRLGLLQHPRTNSNSHTEDASERRYSHTPSKNNYKYGLSDEYQHSRESILPAIHSRRQSPKKVSHLESLVEKDEDEQT
jgi:hypothetical protein